MAVRGVVEVKPHSAEHDPKLAFLRKITGSIVSDAKGQTKRAPPRRKPSLPSLSILEKPDEMQSTPESR